MLSVILAIIGGIIAGIKTPLISPLIYLSKFKKDLFLILFFIYCIALCYEFKVEDVYSLDVITISAVLIPSILLLDSGLKCENLRLNIVDFTIIAIALLGLIVREVFLIVTLFAVCYQFSNDKPRKGIFVVLVSFSLLILSLILCKNLLNYIGGSPTQVVFIAAIGILIVVIFWKRVEKTDMFT